MYSFVLSTGLNVGIQTQTHAKTESQRSLSVQVFSHPELKVVKKMRLLSNLDVLTFRTNG